MERWAGEVWPWTVHPIGQAIDPMGWIVNPTGRPTINPWGWTGQPMGRTVDALPPDNSPVWRLVRARHEISVSPAQAPCRSPAEERNGSPACGSAALGEGSASPRVRGRPPGVGDGAPRERGPSLRAVRVSMTEGRRCACGGRDSPQVRRVRDPRGEERPRLCRRPALERTSPLGGGKPALSGGESPLGHGKAPS
jgi:hypothetical protein